VYLCSYTLGSIIISYNCDSRGYIIVGYSVVPIVGARIVVYLCYYNRGSVVALLLY
jgi:hypothetical protein